ncbi:MAG: nitrilase-related carbon-nitrogen hydrolase [Chloroflexota bacterium]
MIEPYFAAICQAERVAVRSGGKIKENIKRNLDRYCNLIEYCCTGNLSLVPEYAIAGPVKLITFGEFSITGLYSPADPDTRRFTNKEIIKNLGILIPGEETAVLAGQAKKYGVYIAAANTEFDPEWPDFHFNTAFIINPQGKIILKYRKTLVNNPVEIACTAHDVMDRYVNPITKKLDPFPVVDTKIGRLACCICADLGSPEIPRIYAMKGSDVVMHLTSGNTYSAGGPRPIGATETLHRARAIDNSIYWINSNWGPEVGAMYPRARIAGYSKIYDYMGNLLAMAEGTDEMVIRARLDIETRRKATSLFYRNSLSQIRSEIIAPYYSKPIYPANTFLKGGPIDATLDKRQIGLFNEALDNLKKRQDFYSEEEV